VLTRLFVAPMVEAGWGRILNMSSIVAAQPLPTMAVYGATKAFQHMLSLNLRADLAGTRVRVTTVAPGLTKTEFAEVRAKGDRAAADAVYRDIEALLPEDVADAVFWAATRPAHVNINSLEVMSVAQTFGPMLRQRDLPD